MTHTPHRTQTEPLVAALGGGFKSATIAVNGVALHCVHGGFAYVFKFGAFAPAELRHYVEPYAATTQLHAACEMYRALPENARFNATQRARNDVPLVLAAGEQSPFAGLPPTIAKGLHAGGCCHVETELIANCAHYNIADRPEAVAALIERHACRNAANLD